MDLTFHQKGSVTVVALDGSLDSKTTPAVWARMGEALPSMQYVVLDMTMVRFLSSAGLRMLLLAYRQVIAQQGQLILVGLSQELQSVMSHTGFIRFFVLAATEDEALALLA